MTHDGEPGDGGPDATGGAGEPERGVILCGLRPNRCDAAFVPQDLAFELAAAGDLLGAATWGGARAVVRRMRDFAYLDVSIKPEDEDAPTDDAAFDPDLIPGRGDGDFPPGRAAHRRGLDPRRGPRVARPPRVQHAQRRSDRVRAGRAGAGGRELERLGFTCVRDQAGLDAAFPGW